MEKLIKVAKALSDPNRVKILKMLQHKIMCVCELTAALGLAQPTVSKHLRILEDAGFVYFRKNEKWVNYYLADGKKSPYAANLLGNMKHWLEDDPDVAVLVKKLPEIKREDICGS
jgi:ArsR family transcriptional regulator, arsenate/arsenite/antimonite-responsive transcriptional repressor